jgi:hypothetical protein
MSLTETSPLDPYWKPPEDGSCGSKELRSSTDRGEDESHSAQIEAERVTLLSVNNLKATLSGRNWSWPGGLASVIYDAKAVLDSIECLEQIDLLPPSLDTGGYA